RRAADGLAAAPLLASDPRLRRRPLPRRPPPRGGLRRQAQAGRAGGVKEGRDDGYLPAGTPSALHSLPMPWYEDWFDSDAYELVYEQHDLDEAERLADLIERVARPAPGADVLDVGTGRGRHARVLARRGYRVTGLDLSENAVATAQRRAAREGLSPAQVVFVQGDMRLPHFQERFEGVVNLFTSFGFFEDEADHGRAVRAMAAALKPG